jgi:hypothetical protein
MATTKPATRGRKTKPHSVRTTDELWATAKKRAEFEGVTMSHVINELLEGWAHGLLDLPTVTKEYNKVTFK